MDAPPASEALSDSEEESEDSSASPEAGAKRVLVLEDDPTFREVMGEFLAEAGYDVIAVQSGVEGIQEVVARDFSAVLCDMMMPGLPGDLFFKAVERARPALCERFIFMTGLRQDERANQFLAEMGGTVLIKPFPLSDLLAAIAVASHPETQSDTRIRLPKAAGFRKNSGSLVRPLDPTAHGSQQSKFFGLSPAQLAGGAVETYPARRPKARPVQPVALPRPRPFPALVPLSLLALGMFAAFGAWHFSLARRLEVTATELRVLEAELAGTNTEIHEAKQAQDQAQSLRSFVDQAGLSKNVVRWTEGFRCLATAAGPAVELKKITARGDADSKGAGSISIQGTVTSPNPRQEAGLFLGTLKASLAEAFGQERTEARFDRLANVPRTTGDAPGQDKVFFVIDVSTSRKDAEQIGRSNSQL